MKAYLATHFFDMFGFEGTAKIADIIRKEFPDIKLYVPQENASINDKKNHDNSITDIAIYEADMNELLTSDILIAYIDGVEIDAGVAGEILAKATQIRLQNKNLKPIKHTIIGIYTDMRQHGTGDNHMYKNLFVKGAINKYGVIVSNLNDLISQMKEFIDNSENQRKSNALK